MVFVAFDGCNILGFIFSVVTAVSQIYVDATPVVVMYGNESLDLLSVLQRLQSLHTTMMQ